MRSMSSFYFFGVGVLLVYLVIQNPVSSESIYVQETNLTAYNNESSQSNQTQDTADARNMTNHESLDRLPESNHSDIFPGSEPVSSSPTSSSKRELRNLETNQPLNSLEKDSSLQDPFEDSGEEKEMIEHMMNGLESKSDNSPSHLQTAHKMLVPPRMKQMQNSTEMQTLEDLLDVFSATRLAHVWNRTQDLRVSQECHGDMTFFLQALRRGDLWALQSEYLTLYIL